jgi:hypothetical protein
MALDYRSQKQSEPQYAFAAKDLADCNSSWKVVFLHVPMFNFGGHNSTWGHDAYLPLFHKDRVDLVISGHSHFYERFKPLTSEADKGKWAITHITTGGGGAPLYGLIEHPSHAAYYRTNHFIVFEATQDTLSGRAVSRDGKVFDEFVLRKTGGRYDPTFLATAFDEADVTKAIKQSGSATSGSKSGGQKARNKSE